MDKRISDIPAEHREWLKSLSIISRTESVLCQVTLSAILLLLLAMAIQISIPSAILAALGYFGIMAFVICASPRPWVWRWLGLILLSIFHCAAFVMLGFPQMNLVANMYFFAGLAGLIFCAPLATRLHGRLKETADYCAKDDFKWLVTESPLYLRWLVSRALRQHQE